MEDTTMIKKTYEKPEIEVLEVDMEQQILAGSLRSVSTSGLDEEEELELPGEGLPKTGSVWDDAW